MALLFKCSLLAKDYWLKFFILDTTPFLPADQLCVEQSTPKMASQGSVLPASCLSLHGTSACSLLKQCLGDPSANPQGQLWGLAVAWLPPRSYTRHISVFPSLLFQPTFSPHSLAPSSTVSVKLGPAGAHFGECTAYVYTRERTLQHQALRCPSRLHLSKEYPFWAILY